MIIYDLSKELFSSKVYPGDPVPKLSIVSQIEGDSPCRVSSMVLGSHSGTHMDAPCHFVKGGGGIDEIPLENCVGDCKLVSIGGKLELSLTEELLKDGTKRLLLKDCTGISLQAAEYLGERELLLLGIEDLSVGDEYIHRALLSKAVAVVESLVLTNVPEGKYLLCAQPLKLGGLDGAQLRPILIACKREGEQSE